MEAPAAFPEFLNRGEVYRNYIVAGTVSIYTHEPWELQARKIFYPSHISTSPTGSRNHLASFRFQNTFLLNVWNRNGDRWFSDPVDEVLHMQRWFHDNFMKTISRFSLQANFLMPTWIQDRRKSRIEVWKVAEVPVAYPFFMGIGKNFPFFIYCSSQGGYFPQLLRKKNNLQDCFSRNLQLLLQSLKVF